MTAITRTARLIGSAAMLAALAACGGEKKTEETTTMTTTTTAEAPAPAAPVATAPADPTNPNAAPADAAPAPAEITYASLTGDAAKGEKVFAQCKACHVAEPNVNRVGPTLHAVVGRKAGTIAGFKYSPANKNSGLTWTEEQLFTYLAAPQKVVPGTYMAFAGLKNPQDRADVIAYLKTKA